MKSPDSKRPVTLHDVAGRVGVSHITVSRALRHSRGVNEALRERIEKVAEEMGYRPNPAAAALTHLRITSKAKPIQAVLAWLNFWPEPKKLMENSLFGANWKGAVAAADALGYRVEEFICGGHAITPQKLKTILVARGIRGLLLPPQRPAITREEFDFDWSQFAVIRIGRSVSYPATHVVSHSQAHDTIEACRRIRQKGYLRIGFVTTETIRNNSLFAGGYLQAESMAPRKDQVPILVLSPDPTPPTADVLERLDAWMKKHRPEAILSTENNMKSLLGAAGYRVPEDVGLAATSVSISDADAGTFENAEVVGRIAVQNLVGLMHRNELGIPESEQDILVRGTWQDGASLPERQ